jgi:sterol 3beta-glucosyltransferase
MRLIIPTIGTRGDMQAFAGLGVGLRDRGHYVRLATHETHRRYVNDLGLDFEPLPGDPRSLFEHPGWNTLRVSRFRPQAHVRLIHEAVTSLHSHLDDGVFLNRWDDADAIIFNPTTTFGKFVADQLGKPSVMAAYMPMVATRSFAHPVVAPRLRLGQTGNYLSWLVGERMQKQTFQEPLRPSARRSRDLPILPLYGSANSPRWPPFPVVHGYSPAVVPRPKDWPKHVHVTGWWFSPPSKVALAPELEQFLAEGRPPIYVGFGSMHVADPERVAGMLLEAIEVSGDRLLVYGIDRPLLRAREDRVLICGEIPFDLLFPRVKGVVVHGGSGTVGLALRAGRPTLVTPFVFDQFFWGERINRLGAGPAPIPYAELDPRRLGRAFLEMDDPGMRAAAAQLAQHIVAEDGIADAVQMIECELA